MPNSDASFRYAVLIESLEARRLFAWGAAPKLIDLDDAIVNFPTLSGRGQTVAIVDTGINYMHPSLGGGFGAGFKVIGGYDFVDNDADPRDTYGHGTAVAGIIAASNFTHNGFDYRGVAPDASLVALRIDESNDPVPDERIEAALQWIVNNRTTYNITVVNVSFGYGRYSEPESSAVFGDELAALRDVGVFIVSSSGNNGVDEDGAIQYPGADPNVFAVGAVDALGTITEFTERGALLDILAPGNGVATTALTSGFRTATGTSFATPFIAAAAALMRQADPALKPIDIQSIFRASSIETHDGDDEFGTSTDLTFPRLNVNNALAMALARRSGPLGSTQQVAPAGNSNAIVYDRDGVLHLVYYDSAARTLKYATRSSSRAWSTVQIIDNSPADLGQYVSLALDQFGKPAVAYFDGTSGDLKYAEFNGANWTAMRLDSRKSVGLYPSLAFDHDDHPAISYYYKGNGDLKLARYNGTSWIIDTIDSDDDVGRSTSLAIDSNGDLGIAYEKTTTGQLHFAKEFPTGWSRTIADDSTLGLAWISLAFDKEDRPAVSYYDAYPANLKYARQKDGRWTNQTIASKGAQGLYSTLVYDDQGTPNIVYYNRQLNNLLLARGTFDNWTITPLQSGGGRYVAADLAPGGDLTYSWFTTVDKILNVNGA